MRDFISVQGFFDLRVPSTDCVVGRDSLCEQSITRIKALKALDICSKHSSDYLGLILGHVKYKS